MGKRRFEQRLDVQYFRDLRRGADRERAVSSFPRLRAQLLLARLDLLGVDGFERATESTTSATGAPISSTMARAVAVRRAAFMPSNSRRPATGNTEPRRLAMPSSAGGPWGTRAIGGNANDFRRRPRRAAHRAALRS